MYISKNNSQIAAVVIGRNEGPRLVTCLVSLLNHVRCIVYVDSGSSDNSLEEAERLGIQCLSLDMTMPFTAARARNEGANYLIRKYPDLTAIQFIDGDCELQSDWIEKAQTFLEENTQYAVVCGRRRERFPEHSVYNQLCDIEWDTPIGDAMACGGDALIRVKAFNQINGYRNDLIAGEEPEMCFRLREQGWKICRLNAEMTIHDAAMTKLSQWWNRARRAGHAYAESYYLHNNSSQKFRFREVKSFVLWGGIIPFIIFIFCIIEVRFLLLFIIYPLQVGRLILKYKEALDSKKAFLYAISNVFAKFAQFMGSITFIINKFCGKKALIIEYK